MNIRYCLACEETVTVENGVEGHTILVGDTLPFDVDFCDGPFTSSEPPVNFETDWDLDLVEPSAEELAVMDANAELFLVDLGL